MNLWVVASGILSLVTAGIHVFLGGPQVHVPVQLDASLTVEARATMAVVWHGITAILFLSGAAKIWAGCTGRMNSAVAFVAAQYLALAVLFVGYGAVRFGSLWVLPQWSLFVVMAGLIGFGMRYPAPAPAPARRARAT